MSDEALNKHLDCLDKCAEEQIKHKHYFLLSKQTDSSYLLTCSCHEVLTINQMNCHLAENEALRPLRQWLLVILDCADFTAGNCKVNEMIGAVLPKEVIEQARDALLTKQG